MKVLRDDHDALQIPVVHQLDRMFSRGTRIAAVGISQDGCIRDAGPKQAVAHDGTLIESASAMSPAHHDQRHKMRPADLDSRI